ncbi:MAG: gamma-glutamyl-gamma-aminobutyrate hydrolase family protein [Bacteroidia bacterium]|nr:gamma-glutamyl-gamma-aminobutyrate hydrolase family protein [Bacteroidia bacterium]
MKNKPLKIGIPARFMYPEPGRSALYGSNTYACVEQQMLEYVSRAGALPIMIPPLPEGQLLNFLREMDGILLQGGSDVAPESYGEQPIHPTKWKGDRQRDIFELNIIEKALELNLPLLGICRGSQIMNVYFGGTLYQDIGTQIPQAFEHRNLELYDQNFHSLRFAAEGLLQKLYGNSPLTRVNTVHHQGFKNLGKGLIPEAWCAEDGLVEAYSWEGAPPGRVMGVQWHPEFFVHAKEAVIDPDLLLNYWLEFC